MSGFQLAVFTRNLLFWSSTCFLSHLSHWEWEKEGVDGDFTVSLIGIHGKDTCCFLLNIKGKLVGKWCHVTCSTVWILEAFWARPPEGALDNMKQQKTDLIVFEGGQTHSHTLILWQKNLICFSDMLWCTENWHTRVRARDMQVTGEVCSPCRCVTVTAQMCVWQVWWTAH